MSDLRCREAANLAHLNNEKLDNLIQISKIAAKKGGDILLDYYGKLNNIRSKGRAGDLVTDADIACEKLVVKYLKQETPVKRDTKNTQKLKYCYISLFAKYFPLFFRTVSLNP